jgi:hypothetical protein
MYSGPIPGVILLRASIAMCLLVMGGLPASIVTAQVDHSSLSYSEAIPRAAGLYPVERREMVEASTFSIRKSTERI